MGVPVLNLLEVARVYSRTRIPQAVFTTDKY
jgi:hypothetical protein